MIDLHMHTTASDGTCTPESLVEHVWQAGIRTMSVTDHDTMAGVAPATAAAAAYGMTVIPGIEITAVDGGRDVHVLAYFISADAPGLQELLTSQRRNRIERAREIADRLAALGAPIDVGSLVEAAAKGGGKALARPQIARALIEAGHVGSVAEAFDKVPLRVIAGVHPTSGCLARRRRCAGHGRRGAGLPRPPRVYQEGRDHPGARDRGPGCDRGLSQLSRSYPAGSLPRARRAPRRRCHRRVRLPRRGNEEVGVLWRYESACPVFR